MKTQKLTLNLKRKKERQSGSKPVLVLPSGSGIFLVTAGWLGCINNHHLISTLVVVGCRRCRLVVGDTGEGDRHVLWRSWSGKTTGIMQLKLLALDRFVRLFFRRFGGKGDFGCHVCSIGSLPALSDYSNTELIPGDKLKSGSTYSFWFKVECQTSFNIPFLWSCRLGRTIGRNPYPFIIAPVVVRWLWTETWQFLLLSPSFFRRH
mgnify:CR=1 FL=1